MNSHSAESLLALPVVLLAAAIISVPIARFARLSAIVAYLVAGVAIGPYGLGMFTRPETIVTVAELGVVMLLFLIGLELELSRLLAMRRDIFGLGLLQVALCGAAGSSREARASSSPKRQFSPPAAPLAGGGARGCCGWTCCSGG